MSGRGRGISGLDGEAAASRKSQTITVGELSRRIHDLLEDSFGDVWVEGEVSDPRTFPSGHTYFTLKDSESQIQSVLFKGAGARLRFKLEHGLQVVVRGRVSTYVKRGQYQLIASGIEPKAAGALQLAFEQLKRKLQEEGLFDAERKKALPPFPERIGIVTSIQGAAVRDMLSVLRRRFEGLTVRVYPVQVQGDGAAEQVAEAIRDFNEKLPDTDVLLVGRGGGSLEDLWAFNEEVTARAIAASRIPVVSCVGHETDFTIADFVADKRAPTPSAAAELVVRQKADVLERVRTLSRRLGMALWSRITPLGERLRMLSRSPFLAHPQRIFEQKSQRIDELAGRVSAAMARALERAERDLKAGMERLDALSPLKVLGRGYAIALKELDGKAVRSAAEVRPGDRMKIRLHAGEIRAEVLSADGGKAPEKPSSRTAKPPRNPRWRKSRPPTGDMQLPLIDEKEEPR